MERVRNASFNAPCKFYSCGYIRVLFRKTAFPRSEMNEIETSLPSSYHPFIPSPRCPPSEQTWKFGAPHWSKHLSSDHLLMTCPVPSVKWCKKQKQNIFTINGKGIEEPLHWFYTQKTLRQFAIVISEYLGMLHLNCKQFNHFSHTSCRMIDVCC